MQDELRIPEGYTAKEVRAFLRGAEQLRQFCLRGLSREFKEIGWSEAMIVDLVERIGLQHEVLPIVPEDYQPID
jgi:hypothetical protein